jgi:hypothetical protein
MENLALARIHCDGLRDLVAGDPASWKDERALQLIRALCARALEVMHDRASRECLRAIDEHASALFWKPAGRGPAAGPAPYILRREIRRQVRLLWERLTELTAGAPASLPKRERYANTLREAARSVGGSARLAALLRVPPPELRRWVDGAETAPLKVFLAALNIVAGSGTVPDVCTGKPAWRRARNLRYVSAAAAALFTVCVTLYASNAARREAPAMLAAAAEVEIGPVPVATKPRKAAAKRTVARKAGPTAKLAAATTQPSLTVALQEPDIASVIPASPQY